MSVEPYARPATGAADRCQADYFRDELNRELVAIDQHADKLQAELADHVCCKRSLETYRLQGELRGLVVTRRKVVNMLAALACDFPHAKA